MKDNLSSFDAHGIQSPAEHLKSSLRRDGVSLCVVLLVAILAVHFLDTGALASWVAQHQDTMVDEVIVAAAILLVALSYMLAKRWLELQRQLTRYASLFSEMQRLGQESASMAELGDLLQSCLSVGEAHQLISDRAKVLFPKTSGAVCITASSRDVVEVAASWGEPLLVDRAFSPNDCWALRRGRVHGLDTGSGVVPCAHLSTPAPVWSMCVPMMAHGEALGLLYLDGGNGTRVDGQNRISPARQQLAKSVAEHTALALANLRLREILKMQSVRDPLTGLFNRRYMEESLERELRRAVRKKTSLGIIMLDVDHFKSFNDRHGHEAGDAVLRSLGTVLRTQVRAEDIVCRYGGEEFAMILPDATVAGTRERAQQLRMAASQIVTQLRGQTLEPITLSIGITSFPEGGATGEQLLRTADAALYKAKESGRNRVEG